MKNKTKICNKCGKEYPATREYFSLATKYADKLSRSCTKCLRDYKRQYYRKNKKRHALLARAYRLKNKSQIIESKKQYYRDNKEQILGKAKRYAKNHKKEKRQYDKQYKRQNVAKVRVWHARYYINHIADRAKYHKLHYSKNREEILKWHREYYRKHKKEICERDRKNRQKKECKERERLYRQTHKNERNKYERNRRKTDLECKILHILRGSLYTVLKSQNAKKSDHTKVLVGCTIKQLIKHIESQFDDKMTWNNYGRFGWHIDHIKPCVSFDLVRPEEQRRCFNYKNLQPLWWKDNLEKNSFYKGKLYRKRRLTCQV